MASTIRHMANRINALELIETRRMARSGEAQSLREAAGLSLAEMGAAIGTSRQTVFRWERGTRVPRAAIAARFYAVLQALREQQSGASDREAA